jgi:hypothetical protein
MNEVDKIKDFYEDGYRCIYHNCENKVHKVYLKNFDTEKSEVIELDNEQDFCQFTNYINGLRTS